MKQLKTTNSFLFLIFNFLIFQSCVVKKSLDSVNELDKQSKFIQEKLSEMNSIGKSIVPLSQYSTISESSETRNRKIENLEKSKNFDNKIRNAAIYIQTLSYMLVPPPKTEEEEIQQDEEILVSLENFFELIESLFYKLKKSPEKINIEQKNKKGSVSTLLAFSFPLDQVNQIQVIAKRKDPSLKVTSLFNLFEDSLLLQNDAEFKIYHDLIMENKENIIYLLKYRHSVLLGVALDRIAPNITRKRFNAAMFLISNIFFKKKLKTSFSSSTPEKQKDILHLLTMAKETKNLLIKLEEKPHLPFALNKIIKHIKFKNTSENEKKFYQLISEIKNSKKRE